VRFKRYVFEFSELYRNEILTAIGKHAERQTKGVTEMKTIVVSIGNSDNKLTQSEWSQFVADVAKAIQQHTQKIHFFGGSPNWERWQNVAWLFDCQEENIAFLKFSLAVLCRQYEQDSIAYIEGETVFLSPK